MAEYTKINGKLTMKHEMPEGTDCITLMPPKFDHVVKIEHVSEMTMRQQYELATSLLSRNDSGREFTFDEITAAYDFQDITRFFNDYGKFIQKISNEKN